MAEKDVKLENLDDIEQHPAALDQPEPAMPTRIGLDGLPTTVLSPEEIAQQKKHTEEEAIHEEEEEKPDPDVKPIGAFGTVMNLLNSLIGAGILSVPSSFVNCGVFPSIVLLILMGVLAWVAAVLVMMLKNKTGASGFDDLVFRVCGKVGSGVFSTLNLIFLICATLAYIILGGDMILSWFSLANVPIKGMWRALVIFVYGMVLPIPLTIPRNIKFLSYFSTVSLASILFFVICMVIKAVQIVGKAGLNKTCTYGKIGIDLFGALSIFSASFALPAVIIPIIRPFSPNITKRRNVSFIAICIAMTLCTITGICGYISFGTATDGNVLKNFADNDILIIVVRSAFFLVVSFAYPAISQSIMASWSDVFFKQNNPSLLKGWKRAFIIVVNNIIPLVVAMFLSSAKPAIAIGGALGGNIVNYVFPSVMWIMKSGKPIKSLQNILCIIFAIFGCVTTVISTYYAILGAIDAFK